MNATVVNVGVGSRRPGAVDDGVFGVVNVADGERTQHFG
jgi:hypothetical protein